MVKYKEWQGNKKISSETLIIQKTRIIWNLHFLGWWAVVVVASVPPAGHNSGAPPLIKRSLVSLFVSNWPIGGSQSSRTTCPPTSHNLIHIFYCAENITYIMEKYYNICRKFPSVFTVSKLAWIMSWRIVVDRDWVSRRDYALQHLALVTSSMMIAHQWNYGHISLLAQA